MDDMDWLDKLDEDAPKASRGGALGELPWRARFKIKAKALWDVCPDGAQGLIAWMALAPLLWASIAAMGRLGDGGQGYKLKWGEWSSVLTMGLPALALAFLTLPAARGIAALRRGGLLQEYKAAIRGLGPSGAKESASAGEWALWCWGWALAAFATWLAERSLRTQGMTMGREAAWLLLSAARVEICLAVLATCVAAALSKAGAFSQAPASKQELSAVDWGRAVRGAKHARLAAGQWAKGWVARERGRWDGIRQAEPRWAKAWSAWWGGAPFGVRALSMSLAGAGVWAASTNAARLAWDPSWLAQAGSAPTVARVVGLALLSALLSRLFSRPPGQAKGAGLWFGPQGPSMPAWLGFAGAGFALDRLGAFEAQWGGMCEPQRFGGGGFFAAVSLWLILVWGCEAMGWLGGFFEAWGKQARERGGWRPWAVARVGWERAVGGIQAAKAAGSQLAQAVESKALENAPELAKAQRKELEEAIAPAPRRSRGPNRL